MRELLPVFDAVRMTARWSLNTPLLQTMFTGVQPLFNLGEEWSVAMGGDRYFISCDWGSSRFRLRLAKLTPPCEVVATVESENGALAIAQEAQGSSRARVLRYEQILCQGMDQLAQNVSMDVGALPVIISGMAGSSIGWRELPYAKVPFRVDGHSAILDELPVSSMARVVLVSGIQTDTDILRGEETHVVGILGQRYAEGQGGDCIVVLPGTHSKHLFITNGAVHDFRTYMTGELYSIIRQHSILRSSLTDLGVAKVKQQQDWPAFIEGATLGAERRLSASLFRVRTNDLLQGLPPEANSSFLSGVLFGNEFAGLRDEFPNDLPVMICGGQFADAYQMLFSFLAPEIELEVISQEDTDQALVRGHATLLEYVGG